MNLFHATNQDNLSSIAEQGLNTHSYWTSDEDVLAYYVETVEDEAPGSKAVVLTIDLACVAALAEQSSHTIEPDYPGIEEPITGALGRQEEEILEDWEASEQTWQDCLEIVKSIRIPFKLAPESIFVCTPDGENIPLCNYKFEQNGSKRRVNP